jgi:hypothetical protein
MDADGGLTGRAWFVLRLCRTTLDWMHPHPGAVDEEWPEQAGGPHIRQTRGNRKFMSLMMFSSAFAEAARYREER